MLPEAGSAPRSHTKLSAEMRSARSITLLAFVALTTAACGDRQHPGDSGNDAPVVDVVNARADTVANDAVDDESFDAVLIDGTDVLADVAPEAVAPDAFRPECSANADCIAPACRSVSCVSGRCVVASDPAPDGQSCDDGDLCTRDDRCASGACVAGARMSCGVCAGDVGGTYLVSFAARWNKTPHQLVVSPDDSAAMTGFADSNLWFARVPANGVGAIEHQYGDLDRGDVGYALASIDGGFLLAGYSQVGGGAELPWVVRTDPSGSERSTRAFFADRGGSFLGIVAMSGGGFVGLANAGGQAALTRIGADGSVVWTHDYYAVRTAYALSTLVMLPDGGFAFAGSARDTSFGTPRVVRTDAMGAVVWDHTFSRSSIDELRSIVALDDGGLVVGGRSNAGPAGSAWLMHLDSAGTETWSRYYGTDINASIDGIARTADGFALASRAGDDAWIIRTDAMGQLTEEATLALGGYEQAHAIAVASDGSLVVAGTSGLGTELPTDAWMVRVRDLASLACPSD